MHEIVINKRQKKIGFFDVATILICLMCIVQFFWLAYENLINLDKYVGYDSSMNLLYAIVSANQGKLIASDFECTTVQFITPLVGLLYKLTNNIFIAQGMANLIHISMIIGIVYLIVNRIVCKEKVALCFSCVIALVLCPYVNLSGILQPHFGSMITFPVAYYMPYFLMYLFIIWGYLELDEYGNIKEINKPKLLVFLLICVYLVIYSIFGYEFIIVNVIIPLFICIIIELCIRNEWKIVKSPKAVWVYISSCCIIAGMIANSVFVDKPSATSDMHWISVGKYISHFFEVLSAYVEMFAGLPVTDEIGVYSTSGLVFISGLIMIAFTICSLSYLIIMLIKKYELYKVIMPFVIVVLFCTLFYSFFDLTYAENRDSGFACRYLCIAFISLFFILTKFISEIGGSKIFSKIIISIFVVSIFVLTIFYDYYRIQERRDLDRYSDIKSIIDDNALEAKLVYFIGSCNDDVRLMRIFDTSRIYKDIWDTGALYHWGDYTYSDEAADDQGMYVIFCRKDCEDTVPLYVKSRIQRIGEWDEYHVYKGKETVYDFKTSCDSKIGFDFPYSPSITIDHINMNEKGEYISDGSGNIIMYGPNYQFKEGVYDIILEYEVLKSNDDIAGVFDIVKDEKEIFASTAIIGGGDTVGFYDVPIGEGTWLQYRVGEAEGTVLKINKVVIKCH